MPRFPVLPALCVALTLATPVAAQPIGTFSDLFVTDDLDVADRFDLSGTINQTPSPSSSTYNNRFSANLNLIDGDACIGPDCDDALVGQAGGPLRLRDAAPGITFDDPSTARDWQIRTNLQIPDAFYIQDLDTLNRPFVIAGDARQNALWIGTNGVGFGTSIPQADLHVVSNLTEKLRLQDVGSGADWSLIVATNGMGWFDRDGSGGGTFPFAILEGAPDDAWVLTGAGDVGMGTATPDASLHISRNDGTAALRVENARSSPPAPREMFAMVNNAGSYFTLENTRAETSWFFVHEDAAPNRFIIADAVADGPEMSLTADGVLTVPGGFVVGATTLNVPDYVFEADYALPSLSEVAAFIDANRHLPDVPSAADVARDGLDLTQMQLSQLKKIEELTLYTLEQEARLEAQAREIADLRRLVETLLE